MPRQRGGRLLHVYPAGQGCWERTGHGSPARGQPGMRPRSRSAPSLSGGPTMPVYPHLYPTPPHPRPAPRWYCWMTSCGASCCGHSPEDDRLHVEELGRLLRLVQVCTQPTAGMGAPWQAHCSHARWWESAVREIRGGGPGWRLCTAVAVATAAWGQGSSDAAAGGAKMPGNAVPR